MNIFPNFDNYIRNYYKISSISNYSYKNSTIENFRKYFIKNLDLFNKYKNESKVMLINAWNEWGENMCIEPSNENGFEYLELIRKLLLSKYCS